jgi:hypothetical protein
MKGIKAVAPILKHVIPMGAAALGHPEMGAIASGVLNSVTGGGAYRGNVQGYGAYGDGSGFW